MADNCTSLTVSVCCDGVVTDCCSILVPNIGSMVTRDDDDRYKYSKPPMVITQMTIATNENTTKQKFFMLYDCMVVQSYATLSSSK